MPFPIKTCVVCGDEFELRPDKPGFANRCPSCSEPDEDELPAGDANFQDRDSDSDLNAARRKAMRELLYRREE